MYGIFFREWWLLVVAFSFSVLVLYLEIYTLGSKSDPYRVIFRPAWAEELREAPGASKGIVRSFVFHCTLVLFAFLCLWALDGLYLQPWDWNTSEMRTTEGVVLRSRDVGSSFISTIRYTPEGLGKQDDLKLWVVGPRLEPRASIEVYYAVGDPKRSGVEGMVRWKLFDSLIGFPFAVIVSLFWLRARVQRFSNSKRFCSV